ncbi:MAG: thiamine-phosphate kinase, partial [Sulfurovum sp.]|nr:thiamine-phosphate kinase [Sulfurovum sp.]
LESIDENIGFSGEEYEMLVAFDPTQKEVVEKIAKETGTGVTIFAEVAQNHKRFPCKSHHFMS